MTEKGSLEYLDIEFKFELDNETLILTPKEKNLKEFYNAFWEKKDENSYTPKDVFMEEKYLIGKSEKTGKTIIMLILDQEINHQFFTNEIQMEVFAILSLYKNEKIEEISFYAKELDYIYDVRQGFQREYTLENDIVKFKIESCESKECEPIIFQYKGKNVTLKFDIMRSSSGKITRHPIEFKSYIKADFEPTDDYFWIIDICDIINKFIQFLCNRRNIQIEKIDVNKKNENDRMENIGEIEILNRHVEIEGEKVLNDTYIPLKLIAKHSKKIVQAVSDDKLYMRHIPKTYKDGKKEDEASFVIMVAAFEWEFKQLFKEGIPHSEKTKEAQKEVEKQITNLVQESSGTEKKIYKKLRDFVDLQNISEKIKYTCDKLDGIIRPFGKYLYEINKEKFDYKEIGKRLNEQRNNFAHGNLDKEFIGTSLLDLIFLKYILYAMQLKRFEVEDENIKQSLKKIFNSNIRLE